MFHLCRGIKQELAEYARGASERPLWNLFEGGGAEVLLLTSSCLLLGLGCTVSVGSLLCLERATLSGEHGARRAEQLMDTMAAMARATEAMLQLGHDELRRRAAHGHDGGHGAGHGSDAPTWS